MAYRLGADEMGVGVDQQAGPCMGWCMGWCMGAFICYLGKNKQVVLTVMSGILFARFPTVEFIGLRLTE